MSWKRSHGHEEWCRQFAGTHKHQFLTTSQTEAQQQTECVRWNAPGQVEATNSEDTMRNGEAAGCVPTGQRLPADGRPYYWHPPTTELPRRWNILPGTCDYHVFGTLKDTSTGRHFASGHRAKEATRADLVRYEIKFALTACHEGTQVYLYSLFNLDARFGWVFNANCRRHTARE